MKKKILIIFLFILFSLPIPIAFLGFVFSGIRLFAGLIKEVSWVETMAAILGTIIGATYLFTYIYSMVITLRNNKISVKTFLPIAHCLLALLFLLSLEPMAIYVNETTEHFGFAKRDFSVVDELDTHGGFIGDGSYYLILDCSDNRDKALEKVKDWNKLPLSENLNLIMYGGEKDGVTYSLDLAEEAKIPKVENGYYIFEDRYLENPEDRYSENRDTKDDSWLFDRGSYNFSIAIYDCDTDIMYYFMYDT